MERLELVYTVDGPGNWYNHFGKPVCNICSAENMHPYDSVSPLLRYIHDGIHVHSHWDMYKNIHTSTLIASNQKLPKYITTVKFINKQWHICTFTYHIVLRMNKLSG